MVEVSQIFSLLRLSGPVGAVPQPHLPKIWTVIHLIFMIPVIRDDGDEHIRVLVISRKFDIHHYKSSERDDLIWNHIVKVLSEEETQHVSGVVAVNPEEIKVYT